MPPIKPEREIKCKNCKKVWIVYVDETFDGCASRNGLKRLDQREWWDVLNDKGVYLCRGCV